MTLNFASNGNTYTIKRIIGNDKTRLFLMNLGFVEGTKVSVISDLGSDKIIAVNESRIALAQELLNRIIV